MTIFSLLAELKRDLTLERTKIGLARARASGKKLARPKGPGKSKLDGKEDVHLSNIYEREKKCLTA